MIKFLKFEASWCGQCKALDNVLKTLPEDIKVEHIDVDDEKNQEIVDNYSILHLPVMLLINDDNEEVDRIDGVTTKNTIVNMYNLYKQKYGKK